ncbi:MAG TPA: hypothetical protein VFK02_18485 [Kofleriaceae bacterium]|nr:hypothetical protein [Kofleriaceae bacterium]
MRHKYIAADPLGLSNKRRPNQIKIPAPIIAGRISCQRAFSKEDEIRIDTGADISVLPWELKGVLGLDDNQAVYELDYSTAAGGGRALVFMVNFTFDIQPGVPMEFRDVHVIFADIQTPLFGIWTALEHSSPLRCDFRGMTTSL